MTTVVVAAREAAAATATMVVMAAREAAAMGKEQVEEFSCVLVARCSCHNEGGVEKLSVKILPMMLGRHTSRCEHP